MSAPSDQIEKQPIWFIALYALAAGGGSVAYVPLLTVLLPLKITQLQGTEDVAALASVTFFGAIIASIANILFGWLSDRSRSRMPWIIAGLFTSSGLLIAIGHTEGVWELIVLIMLWQMGLNMMLGPLIAWAGDCFPDSQKGLLGGALSLAPALGALAGSLVTFELLVPSSYRLGFVALLVILLVLPAVIVGRNRMRPTLMHASSRDETEQASKAAGATVVRMWIARFLVQIAEAGLFAFLLFWLRSLSQGIHENTAANIFSLVLIVSVPITLWIGRWSDAKRRPIMPLTACALASAAGLGVMASANSLELAIVGYVLFGIAATIFLSLHTGQTLRVLPQPRTRGRDMGLFNLTNTVPSLVMPWLTLTLVPGFGFTALFALFAALALLAAAMLASIPDRAADAD